MKNPIIHQLEQYYPVFSAANLVFVYLYAGFPAKICDFHHIPYIEFVSYNIFNMTNMNPYRPISSIFEAVSTPARLQIVLAIGKGEACVCHLEALLGMRQAYISQQLMLLREKDLISARRDGKYIYYSLRSPEMVELILQAARLAGVPAKALEIPASEQCECPQCAPGFVEIIDVTSNRQQP
jgi:DNA-binding transcriptional ArsR family regulator